MKCNIEVFEAVRRYFLRYLPTRKCSRKCNIILEKNALPEADALSN
jgi:hypothetical protein